MTIPPALAFLALLVAVAIAPFAVGATLQVLLSPRAPRAGIPGRGVPRVTS